MPLIEKLQRVVATLLIMGASLLVPAAAHADIVLSQLIVELQPGRHAREDVEVWNSSTERAYVAVEPNEILNPGQPGQKRVSEPDPAKLGLLVSPARMILEPGQRKIVRIALIGSSPDRERVYRVTVKPVSGPLSSDQSGIKVMVGYDALVIARPAGIHPNIVATRSADELTFSNKGNVSVELIDGQQCDPATKACTKLPGKRLYAGMKWAEKLPSPLPADYTFQLGDKSVRKHFDAAASTSVVTWAPSSASLER